jgi:hypothetical protein
MLASSSFLPCPVLLGVLLVLPGLACSAGTAEPPEACPKREAAFRLELTAAGGDLPADTEVRVRYQGSQEESYDLRGRGAVQNEDVCCVASAVSLSELPRVPCPGGSPSDAGRARALYCELWTNGIAEVTVTSSEYPELSSTLEAVRREDDCGLETTSVRLVLERPDGGS